MARYWAERRKAQAKVSPLKDQQDPVKVERAHQLAEQWA
jgi:hypothetical protein